MLEQMAEFFPAGKILAVFELDDDDGTASLMQQCPLGFQENSQDYKLYKLER